jgi:multicomponent Na+:H+ antiporter subunit E
VNLLVWNILLALIWAATTEAFSAANLTLGFVLGFALLFFVGPVFGQQKYFRDVYDIIALFVFFVVELVVANLRMAYYVIMPLNRMRPAVIAVPLEELDETELAVFSNLITLTPGTLSLDVSDDRRVIYVHFMWYDDAESARSNLKRGFEQRVIKALR